MPRVSNNESHFTRALVDAVNEMSIKAIHAASKRISDQLGHTAASALGAVISSGLSGGSEPDVDAEMMIAPDVVEETAVRKRGRPRVHDVFLVKLGKKPNATARVLSEATKTDREVFKEMLTKPVPFVVARMKTDDANNLAGSLQELGNLVTVAQ